jgi:hypothetical protein
MEKMDRVKRPLFRNGSAAGSGSAGIENERSARRERTRSSTRTSRLSPFPGQIAANRPLADHQAFFPQLSV